MDPSCLQHRLTEPERAIFEEKGFLQIEDALSPQQVSELTAAADSLHKRQLDAGAAKPDSAMFFPNFIPEHPSFTELVDYERVLPKVWGMLGWNIYLYHAHLIVTPPSGRQRSDATFGWHQDSGRVNRDMETHPRPRLSIKVAYFLSDVGEEGRGNFWVVPGSHLKDDDVAVPTERDRAAGRRRTGAGQAGHRGLLRPAALACGEPQLVRRDPQGPLLRLRLPVDPDEGRHDRG